MTIKQKALKYAEDFNSTPGFRAIATTSAGGTWVVFAEEQSTKWPYHYSLVRCIQVGFDDRGKNES